MKIRKILIFLTFVIMMIMAIAAGKRLWPDYPISTSFIHPSDYFFMTGTNPVSTNYLISFANLQQSVNNYPDLSSVTVSGSAPSPTYYQFYSMSAPSTNFQVIGGVISSNTVGAFGAYYAQYPLQTAGNGNAGFENPSTVGVAFGIDSAQFVLRVSGSGEKFKVVIDGMDTDTLYTVPSDGAEHWYYFTFQNQKMRQIQVYNAFPFLGAYVPITNGWLNAPATKPYRVIVVGDSFTEQNSALNNVTISGFPLRINELSSTWDVWGLGEGGTGWYNVGVSGGTNFLGRINDVINNNPDMVLIFGGINDTGYATDTTVGNVVYNAATNTLIRLRAALPSTPIFVAGPQWPRSISLPGDQNVVNCAIILSNACKQISSCYYVNPIQEPWITGNVNTPLSGNADYYTYSGDSTHPTTAGAYYYARRLFEFMVQNGAKK